MPATKTSEEILHLLREVLAEHHDVAPEQVRREAVINDLGFDSLTMIEVTYQMEVRLGLPAARHEPRRVPHTIGEMVDMVAVHLAQQIV